MTMQPSYLDRAISSELRTLTSSKGGRNNQLFKSAAALYRFSEAGVCSEDVIEAELYSAASTLGLQRDEIRDTLRSGRRRAAQLDQSAIDDIRAKCSGDASARPRTERAAPAPEACEPPCAAWRAAGGAFALFAQQHLHAAPHDLDYLRGRGGDDVFLFGAIRNGEQDRIVDFVIGEDKIDLSQIDANTSRGGNQDFTFGTREGTGRVWIEEASRGSSSVLHADTGTKVLTVVIQDGADVGIDAYHASDFLL